MATGRNFSVRIARLEKRLKILNMEGMRYAELEERFNNFTSEYASASELQAQISDVFFLLTMSCIVFSRCLFGFADLLVSILLEVTVVMLLILVMQTGFAFLEAGAVRSKNTTNILIKNLLDSVFTCILYWAVGYAFAFGRPSNAFIGYNYFFAVNMPNDQYHQWFFQCSFAATACTIVSGSLAERVEFVAYVCYACVISGWVYPVVTHWVWAPEGWLAVLGFQDFAGSGCVHVTGGTIALVSCLLLGPRLGRFPDKKTGTPAVELTGHSTPLTTLGGFILAFGFLAFNGGSQGKMSKVADSQLAAIAMVNTVMAGSWGALTVLFVTKCVRKRWSLLQTTNGLLAGMVAICSGCNTMEIWAGSLTGVIAGFTFMFWSWLLPKLRIDDPLDAFAVHCGCGFWGLIATPIFDKTDGIIYFWNKEAFTGLLYNIVGALAIMCWAAFFTLLTFGTLKMLKILRVSADVEIRGQDIYKHKEPAYPALAYGHGWLEPWSWTQVKRLVIPPNRDDTTRLEAIKINGDIDKDANANCPCHPFYENAEIQFMANSERAFDAHCKCRPHENTTHGDGSSNTVYPL